MEGKAKKITKKVILYVILILLAIIWVIPMFALVATDVYKRQIIERENYNKAKSDDARQPKCPKEKEDAIVETLEFFKMI